MITQEDIHALELWSIEDDAPDKVRQWHAQIILELVSYIRYLEEELVNIRIKNADLDEELRLSAPLDNMKDFD